MNKGELVNKIATGAGITKVQATNALNAFIGATQDSLKQGDKVTLVGFGTFATSERAARIGRNPQTGVEIKIPKKKVVKFKPGKDFSGFVK